jgi:hypothetical protein
MNPGLFDIALANKLGDDIATPGVDGAIFTYAQRVGATNNACKEYGRYRKNLKLFGTGNVYGALTAEVESFLMIGGGYASGEQINIDLNTANAEVVTVASVAQGTPTIAGTTIAPAGLSLITLTEPTVNAHNDGAFVSQVNPGLHLVAGQNVYQLPYDFITIDQSSFDTAVGKKSFWSDGLGFYDASYIFAMELTGFGFGYSANYGVGNPYGYAIAGDPFDNPDGGGTIPNNTDAIPEGFRFYLGSQPQLVLSPTPDSNYNMIPWQYYGAQTPETIMESDTDAVIKYAAFDALTGYLMKRTFANPDRKIGNATYSESKSLDVMMKMADGLRKDFDRNIRLQPFVTSG